MSRLNRSLEGFAQLTTIWTGSSWAFLIALGLTLAWLISGPLFHYSDTWQLVMNTISSIVTFLMVFLIQRSQNKDTMAMQIKLNELLAVIRGASNFLINIENLSEDEIRQLHAQYESIAERVRQSGVSNGRRSIQTGSIGSELKGEPGSCSSG